VPARPHAPAPQSARAIPGLFRESHFISGTPTQRPWKARAVGFFRKAPRDAAPQAPAVPRRRVALVVDDDMTIAELNEAVFAGREWDVRTAYSGIGALADVNERRPDLILLDLMLPDVPGEKVLDAVRSLRLPTKVIVVTGRYVTKKDFEPYEGLVVWVLRKPYPASDLLKLIEWVEGGTSITPQLSQVGDV